MNYDTRSSFCIYAGYYAAIPFMEVWHGLAPDAPDGRSFPDAGHKADHFFEGNKIIIPATGFNHRPLHHFNRYITSRDTIHPVASPLWLTDAGTVPTHSFFITQLHLFFQRDIAGHSMRAGGATSLAENGVSPAIIQASGHKQTQGHLQVSVTLCSSAT